jgi:hypothetical protein
MRSERRIAFSVDKVKVEEQEKAVIEKTQREHEKRMNERLESIKNPSGSYDHTKTYEGFWKSNPDDWDDLKLQREQARVERKNVLETIPKDVILLGCRDCGYLEWRAILPTKKIDR